MEDVRLEHKDTCPECGCACSRCDPHALHLHREIETLKQRVIERDFHILRLETTMLREAERLPHGEAGELRSQLSQWQDKYDRLLESYRKLQRVNQNLEDKLLRIVDKYETDKTTLGQDVANLTSHLVSARTDLNRHRDLSERYRNDLHLAIQLLQCKPSTFISRRLETLPVDLQQKVKSCLSSHQKEVRKPEFKVIQVPISTFPPTAMVYAVDKPASDAEDSGEQPDVADDERVSAAILARVLEERERERSAGSRCTCAALGGGGPRLVDVAVQTRPPFIGHRDALCQPLVLEPGGGGRRSAGGGGSDGGSAEGGCVAVLDLSPVPAVSSISPPLPPPPPPPASEPVTIRQTVVISRPRNREPEREREPAPAAVWWATGDATATAAAAWDNNFDFSPPTSVTGSRRADSVSSIDSAAAASGSGSGAGASRAAAVALRMETRI